MTADSLNYETEALVDRMVREGIVVDRATALVIVTASTSREEVEDGPR